MDIFMALLTYQSLDATQCMLSLADEEVAKLKQFPELAEN